MLAIFLRGIALPAATQITAAAPQPHMISTPEVVKLSNRYVRKTRFGKASKE
jgi:hypothetical protein